MSKLSLCGQQDCGHTGQMFRLICVLLSAHATFWVLSCHGPNKMTLSSLLFVDDTDFHEMQFEFLTVFSLTRNCYAWPVVPFCTAKLKNLTFYWQKTGNVFLI